MSGPSDPDPNGMNIYLDSSAIVKLYAPEAGSSAVIACVRGLKESLPFSPLHEVEVKNAFRLKVFRKEASGGQVTKTIRTIDQDLAQRIFIRPELDWADVFRKAEELSGSFSTRSGARSLDLLHVASCLLLRCRNFLSFDERQVIVARKAKLHIVRL